MSVSFRNTHPDLNIPNTPYISNWLHKVSKEESFAIGKLQYVFLSDEELYKINLQFLNHDTYTDVITFDYNRDNIIIGEIYISLDRVKDNAVNNISNFNNELYRIIIHGLLHLMGYKDKSPKEKKEMTSKEDYYLSLLP